MDWKKLLKKIPRRKYLRPKPPSKLEKSLGIIIITIVVGIGVAVFIKGKYFDANLFRLDPKLINKTGGERVEAVRVTGSDRQGSIDGEPTKNSKAGETATIPTNPTNPTNGNTEIIPATTTAQDWLRKGEIQKFNSDNLYDKVDGREDLYKSYEFHELFAADYEMKDQPKRFIQVELFDMTNAKSAFGIFSAERPASASPTKIGHEAYTDTNGAFFWKGKYYVRVIGSDTEKSTQQAAITIANTIADKLEESKDDTAGKDPLPKEGQIPNSNIYTKDAAFGQSFFQNVSSAKYKIGKFELTGFVMTTENPTKAKSIIEEFGKSMAPNKLEPQGTDGLFHLEAYGSHYILFAQDNYVGGVMEADDKDAAIKLAQQIAAHLKNGGK